MPDTSITNAWDEWSDAYYDRIYKNGDVARLKADPWWAFPTPVQAMLRAAFGTLEGARVLVPSSGDNGAAFAFHLLGASVTSTDISPRQLHNARAIADAQGWNIEFVCADSMALEGIPDGAFDLVYTSNGVHVWIDDLNALYRSFARVLRPGGRYIMFDTHPFNRPFDDSTAEIRLCKDYDDTAGNHWRVMDIFNALVRQGFDVQRMEEFHAERGAHDLWYYRTLEEWRAHVRPESQRMGAPAGLDRPVSTEANITSMAANAQSAAIY